MAHIRTIPFRVLLLIARKPSHAAPCARRASVWAHCATGSGGRHQGELLCSSQVANVGLRHGRRLLGFCRGCSSLEGSQPMAYGCSPKERIRQVVSPGHECNDSPIGLCSPPVLWSLTFELQGIHPLKLEATGVTGQSLYSVPLWFKDPFSGYRGCLPFLHGFLIVYGRYRESHFKAPFRVQSRIP